MRLIAGLAKWLVGGVVVTLIAAAAWLVVSPPELIRVANNYAAKIVCSSVFISGRDAGEVIAVDLKAPGHPIFKAISVDVEENAVRARLLGLFGTGTAVVRDGLGCASVPDGDVASAQGIGITVAAQAPLDDKVLWPQGEAVEPSQDPAITAALDDLSLTGPGMRAVVVVRDGRIIGERYGKGFSRDTPLLGWSMTKTVTAAIIGTLVKSGDLSLDQAGLFDAWKDDARKDITLAAMMEMSSGLAWNEGYGDVSDVTRMLYLNNDMAGFASSKAHDPENGNPEDDRLFNYSSGTSVMLANVWMRAVKGGDPLAYPRTALFDPLGMRSAVMEADASGTFVGSSYMYATARDWARLGLLLAQRGAWEGRSILPSGYVDWMAGPASASMAPWGKPEYGRHVWLHGPDAGTPKGEDPDKGFDLPADTFWALGHDGQSVAIVPSLGLVVVRMGLTPSELGYKPQGLVGALAKAIAR